nr:immunoglobulin light chain junction region [Macaca mulatta]MOV36921.1 immunoglobulin light chain junction region [Macaca mulatta]MOV36945.1 immunoglobulin light chain junction region [Macaca mulatta]MOV36991.1 immunoglobulin light chain junction region [Macaca mulatta]MOV37030.1 immunoglobulin light chain junction region [Macaca mulatta]
CLQYDSEPLTF